MPCSGIKHLASSCRADHYAPVVSARRRVALSTQAPVLTQEILSPATDETRRLDHAALGTSFTASGYLGRRETPASFEPVLRLDLYGRLCSRRLLLPLGPGARRGERPGHPGARAVADAAQPRLDEARRAARPGGEPDRPRRRLLRRIHPGRPGDAPRRARRDAPRLGPRRVHLLGAARPAGAGGRQLPEHVLASGEGNDRLRRADVALPRRAPQVLAAADHRHLGRDRRAARARAGLGGRPLHLHAVLGRDSFVMKILGISAYYHDSAAALLVDGQVAAAAQEERFTRKKHDSRFPHHAIRACLQAAGVQPAQIDRVAFYDKPFLKFERLLETYLAFAPRGFASFRAALPVWVKDKLFQRNTILKELKALEPGVAWAERLLFSEHHLSHAASAFYPSPFERAAVLTMDGVGEWTTTSLAFGAGRELKVVREMHFPHSVGLLYSAFTYYTGFKVNSGEYKVMGLAPYGVPRYAPRIREHLIDIKDDGSFRLNLDYFDYCTGLTMTNEKFDGLFGGPPRTPEQPLTQREMDLAASIQVIVEEVVLKLAKGIAREFDVGNLCLAGGVALNCVANGKLARAMIFERMWMQPAA